MNNLQISKRAIAFLGAVTITLTMASCGLVKNNDGNRSTKKTSIIASLVTTKPTLSSNTSQVTIVTTTIPTTELTTILTTQPTTIPTTIATTVPTIQPTTVPTTNLITTKLTTTKSTTKATTTKPTTKPTTTQPTTKPKLTYENINNVEAIDKLATNPYNNIYVVNNGSLFTSLSYYYDGQKYRTGVNEFRLFISMFNEQYMTEDTLNQLFGDITEEEMQRYSQIFWNFSYLVSANNLNIQYDNFVVNENMKNFLNELQNHINAYKKDGDIDKFNTFINSFYNGQNQYVNHGDYLVLDGYMGAICHNLKDKYVNENLENIVNLYSLERFDLTEYITNDFYIKTRSKQLVK